MFNISYVKKAIGSLRSFSFSELKRGVQASIRELNRLNPNIMVFILYGLLYDTVINIYKPFATKFLERLGGDEFYISLFNSMPGLVAVLVLLPGSMFISRFKKKKKITTVFFILSRTIMLTIAFVPFLPPEIKPLAFVLLISVMNFPEALSQTSLQGFLGNVFNGRVRAQAITLRNKFGNLVVPIVTLISGLIITYLPADDRQRIVYYQFFFVASFLVGIIEIFVFTRFQEDEPAAGTPDTKISIGQLRGILADKRFMSFMGTTLLFYFFWQAGWPLCAIYQIKVLHANEIWLALFTVASGLGSFFAGGFWSKYIYKNGNSKTLYICMLLMAINLVLFPLSPNVLVMTLVSSFGGFAGLGINSSLLNGLLGSTPDKDRIVYLGAYNTFVNLSLFISPLFANVLLSAFGISAALYIVSACRFIAPAVTYLVQKKQEAQKAEKTV